MYGDVEATQRFYDWERRLRGWDLRGYPVSLEPPYSPPIFYRPPQEMVDDARRETFLSRLAGAWSPESVSSPSAAQPEEIPELPEPELYVPDGDIVELVVRLGSDHRTQGAASRQFLSSLRYIHEPLSFEIVASPESVGAQFACRKQDEERLVEQLRVLSTDVQILPRPPALGSYFSSADTLVVDFGLSEEAMRPLSILERFDVDPLGGVIAALGTVRDGEHACVQVLFEPVHAPWGEAMRQAVHDWDGSAFFTDAPEMVPLTREKTDSQLFAAVLRVVVSAPDTERQMDLARHIGGALSFLNRPGSNDLLPLANDYYWDVLHLDDVIERRTHRSGMLISGRELVSFVHLPDASIVHEKFLRSIRPTKAAPAIVKEGSLSLGTNTHHGHVCEVRLTKEQRLRHCYVVGASGTGKSTLLQSMILQDIEHGEGVGVLDPHGDLIDTILERVPEHRHNDVVLFDPSDTEYPIGFNILSAFSDTERFLLESDFHAIFRRLSTSWGDQMSAVLANAVAAFLNSPKGGTLLDLRRFLVESKFRQDYLASVTDPEVVSYWKQEYQLLSGKPQGSVLTRLNMFLRPKPIRYMVGQKDSTLDIRAVMDQGKIFLGKLSHGMIGEENAHLLGAFLTSKFHQIAISRQDTKAQERRPFYLYIDEFQHFVTSSMEQILSGARKYQLGLVLAHQDLAQLEQQSRSVTNSVLTNPYTRICFRVGQRDAALLEKGFSAFGAKDLQNLGIGEAVVRVEQPNYDFNLDTSMLPEINKEDGLRNRETITEYVRRTFGTPKEVVEQAFAQLREVETPATEPHSLTKQPKELAAAQPAIAKEPEVPKKKPLLPPNSGRGGERHKYLQQVIRQLGQERGYSASVEFALTDGGSVDVALRSPKQKIACEISITTTAQQELRNIRKCLKAGFDTVLVISHEKKHLSSLEEVARGQLSEADNQRLYFLLPDEFIVFLDEHTQEEPKTPTVRGYKVRVQYKDADREERAARQKAIARVIAQSMERMAMKI